MSRERHVYHYDTRVKSESEHELGLSVVDNYLKAGLHALVLYGNAPWNVPESPALLKKIQQLRRRGIPVFILRDIHYYQGVPVEKRRQSPLSRYAPGVKAVKAGAIPLEKASVDNALEVDEVIKGFTRKKLVQHVCSYYNTQGFNESIEEIRGKPLWKRELKPKR